MQTNMGLLTDPRQRRRFVRIISHYNNRLCALFYISGLIWFFGLAYIHLNAGTYFSENALLPGLVEGNFYSDADVKFYKNEIKKAMDKDKSLLLRDWLFSKFEELGLEVYFQNYSVQYPLQLLGDQKVPGQNVYAILRAPRASSTEAVVLSVPIRSKNMISKTLTDTSGGIALMLALTKFFKKHTFWAKDIIFLLTQHEHIGIEAWLDGYHQVQSSKYVFPGTLWGRSGSIQAALNLEIPLEKVAYYNIKMEGLNGQLPNLDLVNLVVRLCRREGDSVRLHNQYDYYDPDSLNGFKHSLLTMLRMMKTQASGSPSGNHGLFHRYHIEAVTLQGVSRAFGQKTSDLMVTGRIVEGIFRSLNNLLERFHQSFFFYLMPATNRYISIGLYMPPFSLMTAAGLIKAISLWIGSEKPKDKNEKKPQKSDLNSSKLEKDEKEPETEKQEKEVEKEDNEVSQSKKEISCEKKEEDPLEKLSKDVNDIEDDDSLKNDPDEQEDKSRDLLSIIPMIILSFLVGLMTYYLPDVFNSHARHLKIPTDEAITYGLMALFSAWLFFPRFISKKPHEFDNGFQVDWPLLKCVTLIFQSLVLFSIALMNISLAFFLAATIIPVSVIVQPVSNKLLQCLQSVLLLLVSPPVLIYLASVVSVIDEQRPDSVIDIIVNAWSQLKDTVLLSILDYSLLSCWTYPVFCFAIYPNWIMLWGVSHMRLESDSTLFRFS
ncbi:glycosylphosphatidylinositol anchor attachment 1 protein isoform X2 [Octopus sinensis]|uniref:Glycosylphosphatidylinositol anchor attachment 1 protein isoform X2 n=1 Tax=Octopus sinensis TaxID=2607531 RepID=A0A6P7S621_9MOLL|nr:glycosylphosphatidylinositol anchor attachment 1 protein isoform X2 [Octopus sinensis]